MRLTTVKELFRDLTQRYFAGANVVFSKQSRAPKMDLALVTLSFGNVKRTWDAVQTDVDGYTVLEFSSSVKLVVDLYTHGAPVSDEDGQVFAYENTAVDDMLAFADFLGSQFAIEWCHRNDLSILVDGNVEDLTGIVNDNNYEYRSRMNVVLYYTHRAVGHAAVLSEDSIVYAAGIPDASPQYPTGNPDANGSIPLEATIVPSWEPTSSGGGSEELAKLETGYFKEVYIKEEKQ